VIIAKIVVPGTPVTQGSKNYYRGRPVESSKGLADWRKTVAACVRAERGPAPPLEGPCAVDLVFRFGRPREHYRRGKFAHLLRDTAPAYPTHQHDLDKLARAVLDGMTAGGAFTDDGQVIELAARKEYAPAGQGPGCLITLSIFKGE
jgi:crossover junction endodeoxyribonuclease RusA